jgi:2-oxoglutarate ferredoxin oxidoreductase subunit gamma
MRVVVEGGNSVGKDKWQIVLSGAGGQGLILAGTVLGEAAAIHEELHAVQTQSYGVESRGGFSKAEVVISNNEIAYPNAAEPDVILALTQEAYTRAMKVLSDDCYLLYDSGSIQADTTSDRIQGFPFTEIARELGNTAVVNMVALGAIIGLTGMISPESVEKVLTEKYPKFPINSEAFKKGLDLVK